jgi:hypothetical protein
VWAWNYGDAADQTPTDLAVTDPVTNRVAVIGRFTGQLGALNAGAAVWDFILLLDGSTGAIAASRAVDTGIAGVFLSVGANPNLGLVAVCGKASKLAADTTTGAPGTTWATTPGAAYHGPNDTDILIGLYRADGTLLWARQIGSASSEECDAVTIDDAGDVYAAGVYSGAAPNLTIAGPTPLPNPGSSFRWWIWAAKLDGATGAGLAQAAFGGGAGQHRPNALAVDGAGNVVMAGQFSSTIPFNGTNASCTAGSIGCLASAGAQDGFVAALAPTLAPLWATRIGSATADDQVRGVGVDSFGNPVVSGYLNGSSTSSTVTPTTAETTPIGDGPGCVPSLPGTCALTAPAGSNASYVAKLPGSTGLFALGSAAVTGNAFNSSSNKVSVNRHGAGALRDALLWAGDYSSTVTFSPLSPIVATDSYETFVVFGVLQ